MINRIQVEALRTAYADLKLVGHKNTQKMYDMLERFNRTELETLAEAEIRYISRAAKCLIEERVEDGIYPRV